MKKWVYDDYFPSQLMADTALGHLMWIAVSHAEVEWNFEKEHVTSLNRQEEENLAKGPQEKKQLVTHIHAQVLELKIEGQISKNIVESSKIFKIPEISKYIEDLINLHEIPK